MKSLRRGPGQPPRRSLHIEKKKQEEKHYEYHGKDG